MGLWAEKHWACAASVTPVDRDGRIDVERLARFGERLLGHGLNGLVLFGTMGEGASFPAAMRLEATAGLIERGLAPERLVLGIASSAPAEMAWLARKAGELGLAAVLATPPFFFRDVGQEGVYRAYAMIADGAGAASPPLLLYHIPQVTGVRVEVETVSRLVDAYPGLVRGIKDSEADLGYTRALLGALAERTEVLIGAEPHIPEAMRLGARGTVCGMANLIPAAIARLIAGEAAALEPVQALAAALREVPVIPAVKAAIGERLGDPAWQACVPALIPATPAQTTPVARLTVL